MTSSLKFLIIFRKSQYHPIEVRNYSCAFFNKFKDNFDENSECKLVIKDARDITIDSIYNSDLCEIDINLEFFMPPVYKTVITNIIEDWCDPKKNELVNLWLQIANPSVLENSGKLYHSDVDVQEIAFGSFPDMHHFMQRYHYESKAREINSSFLHCQRKLMVFTCFSHFEKCPGNKYPTHNKFQISYQSIARVIINYIPDTFLVQIFFHLHHMPLLYHKKTAGKNEVTSGISSLGTDQDYQALTWERTLDFGCSCKNFFCSLARIGRCPVFKVVFSRKFSMYDIIERLIQRCPANTSFHFTRIKTAIRNKCIKDLEYKNSMDLFPSNYEFLNAFSDQYIINDMRFKCQFAWEVLNCRSYEVQDQISLKYIQNPNGEHWGKLRNTLRLFFDINIAPFDLNQMSEKIHERIEALTKSCYDISEMITKSYIFTFEDALETLLKYHLESRNDDDIPDGMCFVRRIILMPSKIICLPPTEHFDNRVVRHFKTENFLRVSIQDDNYQKLTFAVQYNSKKTEILKRIVGDYLLDGIEIGPRRYYMLAASNSQLREHGLWMYAEDRNGMTAESIRQWMGDFSHIKNVAKYMARMGQCFSTSDEAVQIKLNEGEVIKFHDIIKRKASGELYKFTDGVGMISRDLAKEVRKAFMQRHSPKSLDDANVYNPSAFQIRFGGCKGMLAEADPERLRGRMIGIRPSMEKFPCTSSFLEIVKISAPRSVFLNRPLITILENLGVKPIVFLELQKKMVFDLIDSLIYEKKALKMLENCTSLPLPLKKLSDSGISFTQEPFLHSLLLCIYKTMIGNLKRKARIEIPSKYGRNMMGVVDETGTLKYGQIFAQYSTQVGNILSPTKILKGIVVVTKNPCMHPGDVRKLEAVDVPKLHHLKDCIVFPARGKRPHPDEMAGSDLDGDEYVLIWDPSLIFPEANCEPMEYPSNKEDELERIEVKDMINFICRYIQHDSIGVMANAHLAWADYNQDGIFSEVCMKIAKKYPQALDFAKSGTTQYLEASEKPLYYPDFMEKGCQNNSYKSQNSLGLLYRVIRNLEGSVSNVNITKPVIPDRNFELCGWKMFEKIAKHRRDQYTKRIQNILQKYGLKSESEALTGYISVVNDCNKNKYDSENIALLSKKYIIDTMKRYYEKFIKDCENEFPNYPLVYKRDIKHLMASAWYMVTYRDNDTTVLSFPWVISDLLSEIWDRNSKRRQNLIKSESRFIDSLDSLLHPDVFKCWLSQVDSCYCVTVLHHTVLNWVKKSSFILTMSSEDFFCKNCFDRIVQNFRLSKISCCSSDQGVCNCSNSCSPMKYILDFYKFYASEVIISIGSCGNRSNSGAICGGFRSLNLQSLALKTYAEVAISQSLQVLGLMDDNKTDKDSDCDEEGDPVRVRVNKEFEDVLVGNLDEVCSILKDLSGVKEIHMDGSCDKGLYYIIVHSIGKAFSRWNLEDLIMDPQCPSILRNRLQIMNIQKNN